MWAVKGKLSPLSQRAHSPKLMAPVRMSLIASPFPGLASNQPQDITTELRKVSSGTQPETPVLNPKMPFDCEICRYTKGIHSTLYLWGKPSWINTLWAMFKLIPEVPSQPGTGNYWISVLWMAHTRQEDLHLNIHTNHFCAGKLLSICQAWRAILPQLLDFWQGSTEQNRHVCIYHTLQDACRFPTWIWHLCMKTILGKESQVKDVAREQSWPRQTCCSSTVGTAFLSPVSLPALPGIMETSTLAP